MNRKQSYEVTNPKEEKFIFHGTEAIAEFLGFKNVTSFLAARSKAKKGSVSPLLEGFKIEKLEWRDVKDNGVTYICRNHKFKGYTGLGKVFELSPVMVKKYVTAELRGTKKFKLPVFKEDGSPLLREGPMPGKRWKVLHAGRMIRVQEVLTIAEGAKVTETTPEQFAAWLDEIASGEDTKLRGWSWAGERPAAYWEKNPLK